MNPASATVRVSGSTSNLGPGFDSLGVALDVFNTVTVRRRAEGDAEEERSPFLLAAQSAFFTLAGRTPFAVRTEIVGDVPSARGLGSSVTVRLGTMAGLNLLCGEPLGRDALFRLCADLEGHPDNAAAAAYGGFTVAGGLGRPFSFPVAPELAFVLLVPPFEVRTDAARRSLPKRIAHGEAVQSSVNACRITAAFARQDYAALRGAFVDFLHQPARASLVPGLMEIIAAGERAGAIGGFLSGSGSTVICLTLESPEAVGEAMRGAAKFSGGAIRIARCANEGHRAVMA